VKLERGRRNGLKQFLIYRHPFFPHSPHVLLATLQLSRYKNYTELEKIRGWGLGGNLPPYGPNVWWDFNIIIKKINAHVTALLVNHGVTFLKTTVIGKID
jgi:hypothetical protein